MGAVVGFGGQVGVVVAVGALEAEEEAEVAVAVLAAGLPGLGFEDEVREQEIVDQGDVERRSVLRLVLAAAYKIEVAAAFFVAVLPGPLVAEGEVVECRGVGEVLGVDEFVAVRDAGLGLDGAGAEEDEDHAKGGECHGIAPPGFPGTEDPAAHQTTSGTTKGSRYSRVSKRFACSSPSIVSESGSISSHWPTIGCSISGSTPFLAR